MLTDYPLRLTAFGTSLPLLAFGHFPLIGGIGPRKGGGKFLSTYPDKGGYEP